MEDNKNKPETKVKRKKVLRVCVNEEEKETIESHTKMVGNMSVSCYLRNLGMGHIPTSKIDQDIVMELAKINADQGRLGGLLKMWLSNDERYNAHSFAEVNRTLHQIKEVQEKLIDVVRKL